MPGRIPTLPVVSPTRIFLNPCHRCRLAKLLDNQWIAGDKEAATVTRKCDFCPKSGDILSQKRAKRVRHQMHDDLLGERRHPDQRSESRGFCIPCHGTSCSTPWNKVFHPMEQTGRRYLLGVKVPLPRVGCAAFVLRRYGLRKAACYEKRSLKAIISLFFNKICKSATKSANPQTSVTQ